MTVPVDVLVVVATPGEGDRIRGALYESRDMVVGGRHLAVGSLEASSVGVLTAGLGKVNVALALGAALEAARVHPPGLLLCVGVGGAYPSAGLSPGDLAVATEEIYGDEGVEGPQGFRGLEAIGSPLWEGGAVRYYNRFPADGRVAEALCRGARETRTRWVAGPFTTLSTVTGSEPTARRLEGQWQAVCESMEGAAVAHAAAIHEIPFGEVRGISNLAGPRDRDLWKLEGAAAAAQGAALAFLRNWRGGAAAAWGEGAKGGGGRP